MADTTKSEEKEAYVAHGTTHVISEMHWNSNSSFWLTSSYWKKNNDHLKYVRMASIGQLVYPRQIPLMFICIVKILYEEHINFDLPIFIDNHC